MGPARLLADGVTTSTYLDGALAGVDSDESVRYSVQARLGDRVSELSAASNGTSLHVLGVRASRLQATDRISLSWDRHGEASAYRLYRSSDPAMSAPVSLALTSDCRYDDLISSDDNPNSGTVYFYVVAWLKDGVEHGRSGARPVAGLVGCGIDYYEPNDDWSYLQSQAASSVFTPNQPPVMFAIIDGSGDVIEDIDWYKYVGSSRNAVTVHVELPIDSPFADGELVFQFYHGGRWYPASAQAIRRGTNSFVFGDFRQDAPTDAVYFCIKPKLSNFRIVAGCYRVKLSNGL
jgi:hypothetical protein